MPESVRSATASPAEAASAAAAATKIAAIARGVGARARRRHARARRRRVGSGLAAGQPLADVADQSDISELEDVLHELGCGMMCIGMTVSDVVNLHNSFSRNLQMRDEHGENLHYGSAV